MFTLCANHADFDFGEGTSVEAYSEDLETLKTYAVADAVKQGEKPELLKWFEEDGAHILKISYNGDIDDDDDYDTWILIVEDKYYTPLIPVNVDSL